MAAHRALRLFGIALLIGSLAGCSAAPADKAGGIGVHLTLANGYAGIAFQPGIKDFIARVAAESHGALIVEVKNDWANYAPDFEQRIVHDVGAGRADLGWVGTRVFDRMGVNAFQVLDAPFLIDSYDTESAVLTSDVPASMLKSLTPLHVTGLAVLGGGIRKPVSTLTPLVELAAWHGSTVQTFPSAIQSQAITALGATPTEVVFDDLAKGLADGSIDGFEKNLTTLEINGQFADSPHIAVDVNLWPETAALFGNPERLKSLSQTQRTWLTTAAREASERSARMYDDTAALERMCASGARPASSTASELAALRTAVQPIYDRLAADPASAGYLKQVESVKSDTAPAAAVLPATCTSPTPAAPATESPELDGTYRWTITEQQWNAHFGAGSAGNDLPSTMTLQLSNGHWKLNIHDATGAQHTEGQGTFSTSGGVLTVVWPPPAPLRFHYRVDASGTVSLTAIKPMTAEDQFVWTSQRWSKLR